MRVLMIHNRYRQRGGEDAAFDTEAALLEARGCRVERLVLDNLDLDQRQGGVRLALNAVWSSEGRRRVGEAVRRCRPEVAHIHNWFPQLSPAIHSAIRGHGVPVVQTLHNFRLLCLNGLFFRDGAPCEDCLPLSLKWPGVARRCYRGDAKASAAVAAMNWVHGGLGTWRRHVDLFLAMSEFARRRFVAAGLPADRVAIAGNTVADPGPEAAAWDRPRAGAVFIGRLSLEKGILDLVQAWRDMGHGLTVIGDGPLAETLRAAGTPEIDFVGWQDSGFISERLSRARLVCVPSRCYEQWPRVLAEAAAHGVPVLASDLGALGELVEDGVTGLRVPAGDARAWREGARSLLDDPDRLAAMGARARSVFVRRYSPDAVLGRLLAHYARLVEGRRA